MTVSMGNQISRCWWCFLKTGELIMQTVINSILMTMWAKGAEQSINQMFLENHLSQVSDQIDMLNCMTCVIPLPLWTLLEITRNITLHENDFVKVDVKPLRLYNCFWNSIYRPLALVYHLALLIQAALCSYQQVFMHWRFATKGGIA